MPEEKPSDDVEKVLADLKGIEDRKQSLIADLLRTLWLPFPTSSRCKKYSIFLANLLRRPGLCISQIPYHT